MATHLEDMKDMLESVFVPVRAAISINNDLLSSKAKYTPDHIAAQVVIVKAKFTEAIDVLDASDLPTKIAAFEATNRPEVVEEE